MSAVIPARNEQDRLPRLLDSLAEAAGRFPDPVEVIVKRGQATFVLTSVPVCP